MNKVFADELRTNNTTNFPLDMKFKQKKIKMKKSFCLILPEAIKLHGSRLSEYERQEIDKYTEIWYLGLESCKINAKPGTALNSGYDDDNGSYNKV